MSEVRIFEIRICWSTVTKALEETMQRGAGLFWLRPSIVDWHGDAIRVEGFESVQKVRKTYEKFDPIENKSVWVEKFGDKKKEQ